MRLVSEQANRIIDNSRTSPANFGLVFNKWLDFREVRGKFKPVEQENKQSLIERYNFGRDTVATLLKNRHLAQAGYCRAMEKAGWRSFVFAAELVSPFVSGLGMSHPTETGMVLDHTSGAPYIPAPSQKGVYRLAHIINTLQDDDGRWRDINSLLAAGVVEKKEDNIVWREDDAARNLFGFSDRQKSQAGQMVVMDAYPLKAPELGEEILNPHFMEYYGGKRGPTEDQSPIPVKFMVVKPGARFVFRMLLRLPFADASGFDQDALAVTLEKNIRRAITEEGIGAKTSLGFGRFNIVNEQEPEQVKTWERDELDRIDQKKYPWRPELRRIDIHHLNDWGSLRQQVLDNDTLAQWNEQLEVGEAVKAAALRARDANRKKWNEDRDKRVAEFLSKSGIKWQAQLPEDMDDPSENSDPQGSEPVIMKKIRACKDWGQYKNDPVDMKSLDLDSALALRLQLKSWGCDSRKTKKDKQKAWKTLEKVIKQLKKRQESGR